MKACGHGIPWTGAQPTRRMLSRSRKKSRAEETDAFIPLGKQRARGTASGSSSKSARPLEPSTAVPEHILMSNAELALDDECTEEEENLNKYLVLHPMLAMAAHHREFVQAANDAHAAGLLSPIVVEDVPVIGKSYDDSYLRCAYDTNTFLGRVRRTSFFFCSSIFTHPSPPPFRLSCRPANKQMGERDCVCGDTCMCRFLATTRHGTDTPLAFVGAEFLLPQEREQFLRGGSAPRRRRKCLLCTRYFVNYLYILYRTDPEFELSKLELCSLQPFSNVHGKKTAGVCAKVDMSDEPRSASSVYTRDGYHPEAMLFVDEEFLSSSPAAREGRLAVLPWRPIVRFCSRHYRYVHGPTGPLILQVGIGADDELGRSLRPRDFRLPSTRPATSSTAHPSMAEGTPP